ncbi:proto-oncogene tyrosine-protein kinase receptor Ret-like isoform X2 [Montipora foliosa]|uniref:proto-oncogene tyrosine-protein kinase receptor Ret-like isoform X2 n=1 Tax=Montipora foliosa TaxID=591990 RepID=UPI0035F19D52
MGGRKKGFLCIFYHMSQTLLVDIRSNANFSFALKSILVPAEHPLNRFSPTDSLEMIYPLMSWGPSEIVVSPRNQTVKEGDDAFFNCTKYETNGSDISGLRYSWRRCNGEAVLSNTSRLNLKNVRSTDAGFYSCTVTNVSANWSEVVNTTLIVKPKNFKISMVGQAWKDPNHKVLSDIVIAGIAVGGSVFFLVIIFMSLLCVIRRCPKRRARPMQPVEFNDPRSRSNDSPSSPNASMHNNMVHEPRGTENVPLIYTTMSPLNEENPEWEYPRETVRIEKYIGKGAFGLVAKAFVDDLGIVAIKIPKAKAKQSNKKALLAEYKLMKRLQHPNIIRLMGAVTLSDPIMVMFEYIPYGDLLGFLKRSRGLDDQYFNDPDVKPTSPLTPQQLLKFAGEIADGMTYLEANKIIHRDLAARNVLLGEEKTCKITDFGMGRDVQQNDIYFKPSRGRLPVKWTAIESLLYGICTTQSDVWSYGIVLYEIFTIGGNPYPNIQDHRIPYMLKDNYRMPQPVHLDDEIYALMCECWQNDANDRPTFEAISSTIRRLQRCHEAHKPEWEYPREKFVSRSTLAKGHLALSLRRL